MRILGLRSRAVMVPGRGTRRLLRDHARPRQGRSSASWLPRVLCLVAFLGQLLALPLHERQIAAQSTGSDGHNPVSTLPFGGHDDSRCAMCAAAHAPRSPAPAAALEPFAPSTTSAGAFEGGIDAPREPHVLSFEPRAPPLA
jgi:hypothetical protein